MVASSGFRGFAATREGTLIQVALRLSILAVSLAVMFEAGIAGAAEREWRRYANDRYRFQVCYPSKWKAQTEAPNSDGRVFRAADGASLTVFGRNDALHVGIDVTAKDVGSELAGRGGRTTYTAGRGNWRVVSGIDQAGVIFYSKVLRRYDQFAILELRYPATATQYEPIVARIGSCFTMAR